MAAGLWPTLDTSASYRRGRAGIPSGVGASGSSHAQNSFQAGFDAAWELDVFGGVRRNIEAADADILAAVENRSAVLVTLTSEVALNYAQLRGFQQQIIIARTNLQAQRRTADLTRQRVGVGLQAPLDLLNAEAQVANTATIIPVLESAAQQTIYSLSLLLGLEPAALLRELSPEGAVPTTPPAIPVGLPSDLLRRRPDIRQAEAQIHGATAQIGVATADLFPKFSLTGSTGLQSATLKSMGNYDGHFWSFGPSVTWTIFDAGRIVWNIRVQNALERQAMITYQQTVLTALGDVESALVAYEKEQEHRALLEQAVTANTKALDLSTRLYKQGQTDFLNVLTAQRDLLATQDALVQSRRAVVTDLIALYKALGGGWENR